LITSISFVVSVRAQTGVQNNVSSGLWEGGNKGADRAAAREVRAGSPPGKGDPARFHRSQCHPEIGDFWKELSAARFQPSADHLFFDVFS
jgi:hypothetical protein